jgi:prenyltransferase beta subunit
VIPLLRKLVSAILLSFLALTTLQAGLISRVHAGTRTSAINSALNWLTTNQQSDGSYGLYTELQAAPAADALWIRFKDSGNVLLAYNWLKNQLQNSTTWFWGSSLGEADVPGEVLYSFFASQHLHNLNLSTVTTRLLTFQQSNGGFKGYFDPAQGKQVTSSVDTAMALWGLSNAKAISKASQQSAVNYLFSLQRPDGSFNLTKTVASDSLYSLGPDPDSITALVVLVLKDLSFTTSDSHLVSALNFLSTASTSNFGGHIYAASLSALAFTVYYRPGNVSQAVNFILSQQNSDGGFRDISRSSTGSNALDTGWAGTALQEAGLFGDYNLDGRVNILDIASIAFAYGSTVGATTWVPHADVDGNGVVNIVDVAIAAANFGKTADSL